MLGLSNESYVKKVEKKSNNKKKKNQNVKSLKDLAFSGLSKMRKVDLNIIYAEYIWPDRLSAWQKKAYIYQTDLYTLDNKEDDQIEKTDLFYVPAYSNARKQFEVSCIDSSHLLTRTRRKCCKGGLDGFTNKAWNVVDKSGKTNLSPAMTECVIDQMSVRTALTHFSPSVQQEMMETGFFEEARLCNDIREWWRAEDEPGISANDRVKMRVALRRRLLQHKDLGTFPPPGMFNKGWPSQLWEAILANIDAKTLLYALSKQKTYNARAFSSLVGETFFSELTLYDRRGQGTVTASEFQSFIGTTIEKLHVRLDKERSFSYHTSRKAVYPLVDATDYIKDDESESITQDEILLQDHFFDSEGRISKGRRKREEHVSKDRNAILRGSQGVRWEKARRNDSKLLPTTRMGIDC